MNSNTMYRRFTNAVLLLGLAVIPVATTSLAMAGDAKPTADAVRTTKTELPREWRWQKPTIRFDGMYRR